MTVIESVDGPRLKEALALLTASQQSGSARLNPQLAPLLQVADPRQLALKQCLAAKDQAGRLLAACLCVDLPGRTASVLLATADQSQTAAGPSVSLLAEAVRAAHTRDVQLVQGLIPPEEITQAQAFHQAGFKLLTQLIYMELDVTHPVLPGVPVPAVNWETYNPQTHSLFARVVQATYQGSLDCASLNGIRHIEDVFATHRATGRFSPRCWLVATVDSRPVATILLAYLPDQLSHEVVYLGVLPEFRRQGYAGSLLRRAVQTARDQAVMRLTLAVDSGNVPALRLYQRFGFREILRRDAWIMILSSSAAEPAG